MRAPALLFIATSLVACASQRGTERLFDGRLVVGDRVAPEAYAAFTRGAYLEASGQFDAAERAYQEAADHDPDSPAIATRLGVLACRVELKRALVAFGAAAERNYAPALAERARCLARHGQLPAALDSARRAVIVDPGNREANLLIADHFERSGDVARARNWLLAWALFQPRAALPGRDLRERAARLKDPALQALAKPPGAAEHPEDARAEIEAAISRDDLSSARSAATAASLDPVELAGLASKLGKPALAAEQAELVLAADPANAEALVVGLLAAASMNDTALMRRLSARARGQLGPASGLHRAFTELLSWYVGPELAKRWGEASQRAQ